MRLTHLTDSELQALLDNKNSGRGALNVETNEHLKSCDQCGEALAAYETLFGQLSHEVGPEMPRLFARRVTRLLPPFRAARERLQKRLQKLYVLGFAGAAAWSLLLLDWRTIVQQAGGLLIEEYYSAKLVVDSLWSVRSLVEFPWPDFSRFVDPISSRIASVPVSEGVWVMLVVGAVAMMVINSLDHLLISQTFRVRK